MEDVWVDLVQLGITQSFVVVVYPEDDPSSKKAYYFEVT